METRKHTQKDEQATEAPETLTRTLHLNVSQTLYEQLELLATAQHRPVSQMARVLLIKAVEAEMSAPSPS